MTFFKDSHHFSRTLPVFDDTLWRQPPLKLSLMTVLFSKEPFAAAFGKKCVYLALPFWQVCLSNYCYRNFWNRFGNWTDVLHRKCDPRLSLQARWFPPDCGREGLKRMRLWKDGFKSTRNTLAGQKALIWTTCCFEFWIKVGFLDQNVRWTICCFEFWTKNGFDQDVIWTTCCFEFWIKNGFLDQNVIWTTCCFEFWIKTGLLDQNVIWTTWFFECWTNNSFDQNVMWTTFCFEFWTNHGFDQKVIWTTCCFEFWTHIGFDQTVRWSKCQVDNMLFWILN